MFFLSFRSSSHRAPTTHQEHQPAALASSPRSATQSRPGGWGLCEQTQCAVGAGSTHGTRTRAPRRPSRPRPRQRARTGSALARGRADARTTTTPQDGTAQEAARSGEGGRRARSRGGSRRQLLLAGAPPRRRLPRC